MEFESWTMKYGSFIYLGLSLCVGYVIWMVFRGKAAKERKRDLAEEMLQAEVARLEKPRAVDPERDGSGLAGPAYTPEQQAAIDSAESERRLRAALEKSDNG